MLKNVHFYVYISVCAPFPYTCPCLRCCRYWCLYLCLLFHRMALSRAGDKSSPEPMLTDMSTKILWGLTKRKKSKDVNLQIILTFKHKMLQLSHVVPMYQLIHWGQAKMAAISRRHFQIYFPEWKCINFDWDFTGVCSQGPINNIPALVPIMAWRPSVHKPLSELMMVSLVTHVCVTGPRWFKLSRNFVFS